MKISDLEFVQAVQRLRGLNVLIVEDEYMLADDLAETLRRMGIKIVGPVPSAPEALKLVQQKSVDLAMLDIRLDEDLVYGVADALIEQNVPFMFVTGYDLSVVPERYTGAPICQKPASIDLVLVELAHLIAD